MLSTVQELQQKKYPAPTHIMKPCGRSRTKDSNVSRNTGNTHRCKQTGNTYQVMSPLQASVLRLLQHYHNSSCHLFICCKCYYGCIMQASLTMLFSLVLSLQLLVKVEEGSCLSTQARIISRQHISSSQVSRTFNCASKLPLMPQLKISRYSLSSLSP